MSRNIVPRVNKGADLGTLEKNWNRLFADTVILRGSDLKALLDGKTDLDTLTAKGDLYVATDAGVITRLPAGEDGYILKVNSGAPEGLMWGPGGMKQELTSNMTVTVGSGGDFSTINAALENVVSLYYPKYISEGGCPRITINLLSGFVMSEQVLVESLDLSWITITGVDAETVINRSALTKSFELFYPAFATNNGGFLPIIGQLFNMNTTGESTNRHGVFVSSNARGIILSGCGVKNAGSYGIYATNTSTISALGANVSGAGSFGILADNGSIINARSINASGAGSFGIYAANASTINARNANASSTGNYGIAVYDGAAIINASNATGTLSQTANTITNRGIIFQ